MVIFIASLAYFKASDKEDLASTFDLFVSETKIPVARERKAVRIDSKSESSLHSIARFTTVERAGR